MKNLVTIILTLSTLVLISCGQPINSVKLTKKPVVPNGQTSTALAQQLIPAPGFDSFNATVNLNYEGDYYGFSGYSADKTSELYQRFPDQTMVANQYRNAKACANVSADDVGSMIIDTIAFKFDGANILVYINTSSAEGACQKSIEYDYFSTIIKSASEGAFSVKWPDLLTLI